jgi:hypothetical protein
VHQKTHLRNTIENSAGSQKKTQSRAQKVTTNKNETINRTTNSKKETQSRARHIPQQITQKLAQPTKKNNLEHKKWHNKNTIPTLQSTKKKRKIQRPIMVK